MAPDLYRTLIDIDLKKSIRENGQRRMRALLNQFKEPSEVYTIMREASERLREMEKQ
ncbi:hypothetical protein [Burkholderia ubonensis]|uniref:hypothetical protein n=1 Tax=Burkholderia ubonensis TaxID=101571 RepID=UPI000B0A1903|nr:hypothetical protein [Burkholderia ubonensis]